MRAAAVSDKQDLVLSRNAERSLMLVLKRFYLPITICVALACGACSDGPASAQGIEERIGLARDGLVRFSFATREGACGSEDGIGFRDPRDLDGRVSFLSGSRGSGLSVGRDQACVPGPMHIELERSGGAIRSIAARVGGLASAPATDLGPVESSEASRYLFAIARQGVPSATVALVAGALASGVEPGPELLAFVRYTTAATRLRRDAAFWLVKLGDRASILGLRPVAADPTVDEDLREHVIFALGQTGDAADGAFLRELYDRLPSESLKQMAIFSLSQTRDDASRAWLTDRALDRQESNRLREQAIFWLTESGVEHSALESLYSRLESSDLKGHVVFGLSRRNDPQATQTLLQLARTEPDEKLRERAIFWLGQAAGREVTEGLAELAQGANANREVQQQVVFALSQRRDGEGIPALMEIARTHRDPEIRKNALFWLGQSSDPRVIDLFAEILR